VRYSPCLLAAALVPLVCLLLMAFVYSLSLAPSFNWHLSSSAARLLWVPSLLLLAEVCLHFPGELARETPHSNNLGDRI